MYAYFEDTKRFWWYLLGVYLVSPFMYALLRFLDLSFGICVLFTLLVEICLIIGIVNHTIHKADTYMEDILHILFGTCDPIQFEQEIKRLLEKSVKNQTQQCVLTYYLAIAYSAQKRTSEALLLVSNKQEEIEKLRKDTKFLITHLRVHLLLIQGLLDEAKEEYTRLCAFEIKKTIYPYNFTEMKQEAGMRLAYMQGEISTQPYIAFIKERLQDASQPPFYKVLLYERLWRMMKRNHQDKERILCAYYIRQNGNTMACVKEAEYDLEKVA